MLSCPVGPAELRSLDPWQAEEFAAYVDSARDDLIDWLPWADLVRDVDSARAFLQRYADRTARDEGRIYGLWLDGRLVGGTLFRVFDVDDELCEIGVWLSPEARGQGLVTQAVQAMIDWAVDVRGIHRIEWHCVPENEASRAVATRLGFTREGVLRESFRYRDRVWDTEIWALLAGAHRRPGPLDPDGGTREVRGHAGPVAPGCVSGP